MVLSGKRRQRIGDLLAGTTVGEARASVPKPESSPLLVVYPVGWLIGAIVWFFAGSAVSDEEAYRSAAQTICQATARAGATQSTTADWIPHLELQYAKHSALSAPASMRDVHSQLLAIEREEIAIGRELVAAEASGDRRAAAGIAQRGFAASERRKGLAAAGLPGCS
jgi:hypothetical protein